MPSSPPVPCNALNTTSGRISRSASTKRPSKSSDCASWPSAASARITACPLSIETSRSALGPPMTTATRILDIRYELSDEVHFEVEIDAERFIDRAVHAGQQRCNVEGLRAAGVDDEVGVERRRLPPRRRASPWRRRLRSAGRPGRRADCESTSRRSGTATGWVALRRTSRSCVRARTAAGSPHGNASVTSATIASRASVVWRYENPTHGGAGCGCAGVWTRTSRTNSPISRSVPAFMRSAPPTRGRNSGEPVDADARRATPPARRAAASDALAPARATTAPSSTRTSSAS